MQCTGESRLGGLKMKGIAKAAVFTVAAGALVAASAAVTQMCIRDRHYAGAFPLWLAPVQVKVIPISEKHLDYAKSVAAKLFDAGVRVETDERNEKVGYKIREAQLEKVPLMLVVGDKEAGEGTVSVRDRDAGDLGAMSLEAFLAKYQEPFQV